MSLAWPCSSGLYLQLLISSRLLLYHTNHHYQHLAHWLFLFPVTSLYSFPPQGSLCLTPEEKKPLYSIFSLHWVPLLVTATSCIHLCDDLSHCCLPIPLGLYAVSIHGVCLYQFNKCSLKTIAIYTEHVHTFFLSLFHKQCSITTIYIAFTLY
jgi:hypothetical protein